MANAQELYEQALEAIDSGDIKQGIELLRQSLEEDSYNLDGWVKLAEVMPDGELKYDVLEHILQLDPNNDFANEEWDRLNLLADAGQLGGNQVAPAKAERAAIAANDDFMSELMGGDDDDDVPAKSSRRKVDMPKVDLPSVKLPSVSSISSFDLDDELLTGVPNRELLYVGGGLFLFTLVMCFISYSIISNANRRDANIKAQETARVVGQTQTLDANATNIVSTMQASTQMAFDLTQTMVALVSPTPAPRGGLVDATEIPPTPTEAPTGFTARVNSAPPAGLPGSILAWGGLNPGSALYLNLYSVNPSSMEVTPLNDEAVDSPSVNTVGTRLIYMRYRTDSNSAVMDMVSPDNPADFPETLDSVFGDVSELADPSLASTGNYLAFTAEPSSSGRRAVFVWDFLNQELIQLSDDGANYVSVAVSAAGNKIVAARETGNGTDLVLFDRDSAPPGQAALQILLTNDGASVVESDVEFSTDGARILYSANANGNADIVMMELATFQVTPLITSPANEILPHYSPDNRYIAYSANPTGTYNLFIMDTISGQIFQVTEKTREPIYAAGWYN